MVTSFSPRPRAAGAVWRGVWRGILRIDQLLANPPCRVRASVTAVCPGEREAHGRVTRASQNSGLGASRRAQTLPRGARLDTQAVPQLRGRVR